MRLLCLPLLLTAAAVAPAEDLKQVAAQHEAEFKKAVTANRPAWFEEVMAPDFWEVDRPGHKMNRIQTLAQIKGGLGSVKTTTLDNRVTKLRPTPKGYVATVDCHMVMLMPAQAGKKPSLVDAHLTYEETWSKDSGVWRMHSLNTLADHTTVDGKPMNPWPRA